MNPKPPPKKIESHQPAPHQPAPHQPAPYRQAPYLPPARSPLFGGAAGFCALFTLLALLLLPPAAQGSEAGAAPQTSGAGGITLLAAGDLRGEIKPCGCSPEGQQGGLPRRLSYLARHLGKAGPKPLVLDLGNNFPPPSAQGKLKVTLIQRLLGRFPPAAILPGPHELALGPGSLDKALPYLVSNDGVGKAFLPLRTVERAGRRLGIFGYLSPGQVYQGSQGRFRLLPVSPALLARWREQQRRLGHELSILLFRGDDEELAALLASGLFRQILAGNPHDDEMNQVVQRMVAGRRVPQVPTKGQGFLRLSLADQTAGDGGTSQVDWLDGAYADHADAAGPFKTYDEGVKALFFAKLETMKKSRTESPYLGAEACKTCHVPQHAIWQISRHAGAVKTLEKVGKLFDPECLACHVVGLNSGGFLSKAITPRLAGVQCENCHGPARAHSLNPKANRPGTDPRRNAGNSQRIGEPICRTCHVGSHSPTFAFDKYWPKIRH